MKHQKSLLKPIALALLSLAASATFAQDKEAMTLPESDSGRLSIGLKFWNANWDNNTTWNGYVRNNLNSSTNGVTVTPTIQYKYKDFALSVSTLLSKDFSYTSFNNPSYLDSRNNGYNQKSRKEYDINFSYFIKPNISASIGYKSVDLNGDFITANNTIEGPIVGLSLSAPLIENIGLYANAGFGNMKTQKWEGTKSATYSLIEAGIAYSLHEWVKNSAITLSYRLQEFKVNLKDNYGEGDFIDTTRGVAIGFTKSF